MKIICELGINTNGSLDTAKRMVAAAAEAGAHGIKVQAYETRDFLPPGHPEWALFEENRLRWGHIEDLASYTRQFGLLFGGTPTSSAGIRLLDEQCSADFLKNGSDFLLRADLIEEMVATGLETWISCGMAEPKEVQAVEMAFPEAYLMACTSLYPCPLDQAHLNRLKDRYDGYSDHTRSLVTAAICTAFGAFMYETHFTLDKDAPGPDHAWSRDPSDLAEIVQNVAEAEAMFGSVRPLPGDQEQQNRRKWRVREGYLRSG